ncbi:hypothetical protein REPUB_Repub04eG0181400 [Reevesia pubescens]
MANKQQISFSLAFLAAAIILLAGQATARRELEDIRVEGKEPNLEKVINDLIGGTQRAKNKVSVLGNSKMVKVCDKAYGSALDKLNKALALVKGSGKDAGDLKATVLAALKEYDVCDNVFAQSTRPSPFIPNNVDLKLLGSECLQLIN